MTTEIFLYPLHLFPSLPIYYPSVSVSEENHTFYSYSWYHWPTPSVTRACQLSPFLIIYKLLLSIGFFPRITNTIRLSIKNQDLNLKPEIPPLRGECNTQGQWGGRDKNTLIHYRRNCKLVEHFMHLPLNNSAFKKLSYGITLTTTGGYLFKDSHCRIICNGKTEGKYSIEESIKKHYDRGLGWRSSHMKWREMV